MAKDPAFLFYDGDAAKDVSHMNRLERGCYFDILQAQRKFGRLTENLIKKILGKDFEACWESVKICLTYDNDMYFIEWLENSTIKRKMYSDSRRKNRLKSVMSENQLNTNNICKTYDLHMENENENENENNKEEGVKIENEKPYQKQLDDMCSYFNVSELKMFNSFKDISNFLKTITFKNQLEQFTTQFEYYKKFKEKSNQLRHSLKSFIGDSAQDVLYQNGAWNAENWENKYNTYKSPVKFYGEEKQKTRTKEISNYNG